MLLGKIYLFDGCENRSTQLFQSNFKKIRYDETDG